MKVIVRGPALTRTGYGEHCRFVLRALREINGLDVYLLPVNWGESAWVWETGEERDWLDNIIKKTALYSQKNGQYDMSIQVTIPNEWQRMAPINIGVTAGIETTKVAPIWLQKCNEMDRVITISQHSKAGFINTIYEGVNKETRQPVVLKCNKKVDVVHYPVKQELLSADPKLLDLDLSTKFNFLTVAQWGPRKNLGATIKWFVEEFIDNPDVGLIVKTFVRGGSVIDKNAISTEIKKLLSKYESRKCKVYLLHGDLTDEEMHSLYKNKDVNALISLTHGEGFGLPLFEAAYCGLPVVATDWSGHLDFLYKPTKDKKGKQKNKPYFGRVNYDIAPVHRDSVWDGVVQKDSSWAYPQQGSFKMKIREVYKDYSRFKSQAKKLQTWLLENFENQKQLDKFKNIIKEYFIESISDQEIEDLFAKLSATA